MTNYSDVWTGVHSSYVPLLENIRKLARTGYFRGRDGQTAKALAEWTSWHVSADNKYASFLRIKLPAAGRPSPFANDGKHSIIGLYYPLVKKYLQRFATKNGLSTWGNWGGDAEAMVLPPDGRNIRGWDRQCIGEWKGCRESVRGYSNWICRDEKPDEEILHLKAAK